MDDSDASRKRKQVSKNTSGFQPGQLRFPKPSETARASARIPADPENTRGGSEIAREGMMSDGKNGMRAASEDERMLESSSFNANALSAFDENAEETHIHAETMVFAFSVGVETAAPVSAGPMSATRIDADVDLLERGLLVEPFLVAFTDGTGNWVCFTEKAAADECRFDGAAAAKDSTCGTD